MSIILKAENISKQYRLGLVGTGTIRHDINRFWHKIRGKEDPYLTVGAVNERSAKATQDYVWALQDINFEVEQGEVLGIIGKNGAGKSTLLKILSRVTSPTTGVIKTRGRIASLLEVGTGFHPELTGRENIYLNGAILGMTKGEIKMKEEEIVSFSGCEMYIDTPVKRYSSGMRVRLGFAVAAFLEPDILVVDEVLAVGDAEFQRKAIGKMQDISTLQGRTVLFVSHNMASVASLCTRGIVLDNGSIVFDGSTRDAIATYLTTEKGNTSSNVLDYSKVSSLEKKGLRLLKAVVCKNPDNYDEPIKMDDEIQMICCVQTNDLSRNINVGFQFLDSSGNVLFLTQTRKATRNQQREQKSGVLEYTGTIPKKLFNEGEFNVNVFIVEGASDIIIQVKNLLSFNVSPMAKEIGERLGKSAGVFKTDFDWSLDIKE